MRACVRACVCVCMAVLACAYLFAVTEASSQMHTMQEEREKYEEQKQRMVHRTGYDLSLGTIKTGLLKVCVCVCVCV